MLEMAMATHAGMSTETFGQMVIEWLDQARHPTTGRKYTDMAYQPMLELLDYLRANVDSTGQCNTLLSLSEMRSVASCPANEESITPKPTRR
jgi:hypothetical protein